MITELTEDQKAKMPQYVEKWINIGVSTDRLDSKETERVVHGFLECINMEKTPVYIVDNPIEAWVASTLFELGVKVEDIRTEMEGVFDGNPKNYEIPTASLPFQTGSFFASTFSRYDYVISELDIEMDSELKEKYRKWEETSKIGCIYPLDGLTIVCQKPTSIHLNENNMLHNENGPALEYDGLGDFRIWSLNGVDVPQWLVTTPAEQIDLDKYNDIKNADVKAEFVRKVGIERFVDRGKKIDTYENYDQEEQPWWWNSEYELYDMSFLFPSLEYAPYLKMLNPTTKIWHLEGVSPQCRKLSDAIKERFDGKDMKIINAA